MMFCDKSRVIRLRSPIIIFILKLSKFVGFVHYFLSDFTKNNLEAFKAGDLFGHSVSGL